MKLNKIDKKYNFLIQIKKGNLIRLGNKMDGGYIVDRSSILKINTFLSFGLGDGSNTDNTPWSFENDLLKLNPNLEIFIFVSHQMLERYALLLIQTEACSA